MDNTHSPPEENTTLEGKQQEIDFLKAVCQEQTNKIFEYKNVCDLLKEKVDRLEPQLKGAIVSDPYENPTIQEDQAHVFFGS